MDFLKTALAPPDFGTGTFTGIPDKYDGRVLTKSFTMTTTLPALTDGLPTYIVQMPVPGVSYFYGQVVAGVLTLTPVYYPDSTTLFPNGTEATNVTSFRYGGLAMEIIPTVNAMSWTGSVQVFRGVSSVSLSAGAATTSLVIQGLSALISSSRPDTVHPFNMGCFCTSRQTETDFPFHPIYPATNLNEMGVGSTSGGSPTLAFNGVNSFVGLGSMESIVYKIPAYTLAGNALTLRTWAHVEFQVNSTSALYEYAHFSPAYDPVALALVKKAFVEMMLCVPFYENDGLWDKILSFIRRASSMLAFVPGPVGEIAAGTSMIAEAVSSLVL